MNALLFKINSINICFKMKCSFANLFLITTTNNRKTILLKMNQHADISGSMLEIIIAALKFKMSGG